MAEQGERGGEGAALLAHEPGEWATAWSYDGLVDGDSASSFRPSLQLPGDTAGVDRAEPAQPKSSDAAQAEPRATTLASTKPRRRRRAAVGSPAKRAAVRRELATVVLTVVDSRDEVAPERLAHFAEAFAATASERQALDAASVLQPKANIAKAVRVALSAVPFLDEHQSAIAQTGVNMALVGRIDTLARALGHAHSLVTSATDVWTPSPYEDASVMPIGGDGPHLVITRAQRLKELSKEQSKRACDCAPT